MLLKAILLGLVGAFGMFDRNIGSLYINRPICTGLLVGLILGDVTQGIIIGATLELLFIGAVSMGSYVPPNALIGGVLATALAISSGAGLEVALTLVMPIGLLGTAAQNFVYVIQSAIVAKFANPMAEKGNTKGLTILHFGLNGIRMLLHFLVIAFGFYFGAEVVTNIVSALPEFITKGLKVSTGILPALGFALLLNMIFSKKVLPYYFLGFLLTAYLNLPIIAILGLGVILAIITIDWSDNQKKEVVTGEEF